YYKTKFGFSEGDYMLGEDERSNWKDKTNDSYRSYMDQLSVYPRVWLLFGFVRKIKGVDEERYLTTYLDEVGSRLDYVRDGVASAYLYRVGGGWGGLERRKEETRRGGRREGGKGGRSGEAMRR